MKNLFLFLGCCIVLTACTATSLNPEAQRVIASRNQPPQGCKYVGQVLGSQGNYFTGKWTSNSSLEQGAFNKLKNNASKLGANYVQLVHSRAGTSSTLSGDINKGNGKVIGTTEETSVTNIGNAYQCPPALIGL